MKVLQEPFLGRDGVNNSYKTKSKICWKGKIKLRQVKAAE